MSGRVRTPAVHRWLVMVIATLGAMAAGPIAHAQLWTEWAVESFRRPGMSVRLLKESAEYLGLSPDQRRAAEELHAGYATEYSSLLSRADAAHKYIGEVGSDNPEPGEWYQLTFTMRRKLIARTETLNTTLLSDLKAILNPSQASRFDAIERRVRRDRFLKLAEWRRGSMPELTELLGKMRLEPGVAAAIAPAIEQYEIELDQELGSFVVLFDRYYQEWERHIDQYTGNSQTVPESIKSTAKEFAVHAGRVVALRRRHLDRVQSSVPGESRAAFDEELYRRLYPAVFKRTRAARALDAARSLRDLDAATVATVAEMHATYERDAAAASQRQGQVMHARARAIDLGEEYSRFDTEYTSAQAAKVELDKKLLDRLYSVLGPERRKSLLNQMHRLDLDLDTPPVVEEKTE